jgi:hypothetical protein
VIPLPTGSVATTVTAKPAGSSFVGKRLAATGTALAAAAVVAELRSFGRGLKEHPGIPALSVVVLETESERRALWWGAPFAF